MPVPPLDAFLDVEVEKSTSADGIAQWTWNIDYWTYVCVSIRGDGLLWVHTQHCGPSIPIQQTVADFRAHGPAPRDVADLAREAVLSLCKALDCSPADWTER